MGIGRASGRALGRVSQGAAGGAWKGWRVSEVRWGRSSVLRPSVGPGIGPGGVPNDGRKGWPEARNRAERREAREKVPEDTCYIFTVYYLLYL
jgi:hypothetical protein